jgi:hypothetical protein
MEIYADQDKKRDRAQEALNKLNTRIVNKRAETE